LTIEVLDADGIEYNFTEDDNNDDVKRLINTNKTSHISFRFRDYDSSNYCSMELTAGNSSAYRGNTIKVEGDPDWSVLKFNSLKEITRSLAPQNNYFAEHSAVFFHILSVSLGTLILKLISLIPITPEEVREGSLTFIVIKFVEKYFIAELGLYIFLCWLFGAWFVLMFWMELKEWIGRVWPSIEFDFGPAHLRGPRKIRKALWVLISLVVIPVVLSFFL
jgi:hypothetical protein